MFGVAESRLKYSYLQDTKEEVKKNYENLLDQRDETIYDALSINYIKFKKPVIGINHVTFGTRL